MLFNILFCLFKDITPDLIYFPILFQGPKLLLVFMIGMWK